jgi:hypothetical protein
MWKLREDKLVSKRYKTIVSKSQRFGYLVSNPKSCFRLRPAQSSAKVIMLSCFRCQIVFQSFLHMVNMDIFFYRESAKKA